ncbi:IclR family transcriptional regulator [Tranquillimonas alkanivorans]|uniref:Transcriptional regulator, IclR family n=1 Tax=Tranquillimonas alkanivorans TaxID=441119 RepID=A0A1I5NNA6_9RHOB|nr:helix-turn-helix domain-containing protein [Tranquillimonas alkanivorans]SFP23289.1 transcriptional regulator, IclR family [Tranquillimonas alkanivorans]
MSSLQTLSRGLRVLELVAQHEEGLTIAQIASALGVHRAIAYRLVATLEQHMLIVRQHDGRITLGGGLVALAARVEGQLRSLSRPVLKRLADETGATAFLCVGHGDECVALQVVEPDSALLSVSYRVGSRHPVTRGAAGLAIASLRPEAPDDPPAVRQAREDGYSVTRGELQPGAVGVAAPVRFADRALAHAEACVGVVALQDLDVERVRTAALDAARALALNNS